MKFYDCKPAPSPRRVRVFMAEKGIEIPTVQVDLRNGEHLKPEFRMINPHCTVPVLMLDDGTRLVSTAAIWRYLEETHPEPPLMGRTVKEKALIADTQWRIETEGFGAVAEALRNSAPGMKDRALTGPVPFEQIPALAERGKKRAELFLQLLEFMVGPKPFLCGDTYSVADIDAMLTVDFAKWIKLELPPDAVNARRWYASVSARPSAKA
jgi:glutathione S-transferase